MSELTTQTTTASIEADAANNDRLKVIIERMPSTTITYYHLNKRLLSGGKKLHFYCNGGRVEVSDYRVEVEPFALQLAEKIFQIDGITPDTGRSPVEIGQYQLWISKGRAFADQPVEFGVINALAEAFGVPVGSIDIEIDNYKRTDEYARRVRMSTTGTRFKRKPRNF